MTESRSTPKAARTPTRHVAGPAAQPVTIVFENFKEFIREYSARISMSGMFIRLEKPYPPGTTLALDLKLGQDFPLIQGTGEVVWTRERAEGPDRPAGVGIRFRDISEQSRDLTYAIVERRMADGGELFRLEGPQEVESQELPNLQELLQAAGKRRLREETKELEPLEPASASPAASGELRLDDDLLDGDVLDGDLLEGDLPELDLPGTDLPDTDLPDTDFPDVEAAPVAQASDDADDLEQMSLLTDDVEPQQDVEPRELAEAIVELDLPAAAAPTVRQAAPAVRQSAPAVRQGARESAELDGFELAGLELDSLELDGLELEEVPAAEESSAGAHAGSRPTEPAPPEPSSEHPLIQGVHAQEDPAEVTAIETEIPEPPPATWHGRPESDEEALDAEPPHPTRMAALDMAVPGAGDDLDAFEPVEAGGDWPRPGQPLGGTQPPPPRSLADSFPVVESDEAADDRSGVDLDELFRVAPSAGASSLPSRHASAVAVSSDDSDRNFKPLLLAVLVLVVVAAGYYYMALVGMVPDFGLLGDDVQQAQDQQPPASQGPTAATSQGQDPAQASSATDSPPGGGDPAATSGSASSLGTSTAGSTPAPGSTPPVTPPVSPPASPPPASPPPVRTASSSAAVRIMSINWQADGGQTRITVLTDAPLPRARVEQSHLDNPPRELVRLVGIAAPYDRTSIDVATPQVRRIRIGYHEKAGGNELHLVIDLSSPSARLDRIEPNGRELVIWIGG